MNPRNRIPCHTLSLLGILLTIVGYSYLFFYTPPKDPRVFIFVSGALLPPFFFMASCSLAQKSGMGQLMYKGVHDVLAARILLNLLLNVILAVNIGKYQSEFFVGLVVFTLDVFLYSTFSHKKYAILYPLTDSE
jgi:hypothetical protein